MLRKGDGAHWSDLLGGEFFNRRGIQRIFDACAAADSPEPNLTLQGSDLWLEFPFSEGYLSAVGTDATSDSIPGATGKTRVKTPVKILEHLRDHPDATLEEVATAIAKSKSAAEGAAAKLRDENRLRYVGPAKGGHWEVIDQGGGE
jgi:ATP-dependent DNA helicase RecG